MSSHVYRNVTRLLSKWPLDATKRGRDLGEHIRNQFSIGFPQGESSKVDVEYWTNFLNPLENISNNNSLKKHPRTLKSTATGLSVEECREIVSTDFLKYLQGDKKN